MFFEKQFIGIKMKRIIKIVVFTGMSAFLPIAKADMLTTDILGLSDGVTNFSYQKQLGANSGLKLGMIIVSGGYAYDIAYKYSMPEFGNGLYFQGGAYIGNGSLPYVGVGYDAPVGDNMVIGYFYNTSSDVSGIGVEFGIKF
jgi:hypothetical protein